MDNLPLGAASDPAAPYNEKLDVKRKIEVSFCIDGAITVSAPKDLSFDLLKPIVESKIRDIVEEHGLILTEVEVLNEV